MRVVKCDTFPRKEELVARRSRANHVMNLRQKRERERERERERREDELGHGTEKGRKMMGPRQGAQGSQLNRVEARAYTNSINHSINPTEPNWKGRAAQS